jgi:hypothetical protein
MTMSRKDHRKFAEVLADNLSRCATTAEQWRVQTITQQMVGVFREDNPRFDSEKFYDAVGFTAAGGIRKAMVHNDAC